MTGQYGVLRQAGEARMVDMGSNIVTFVLDGADTNGAYSLTDFTMAAPPVPGPPVHVHKVEEEAIYVLEGEVELTLDETSMRASAGAVVFVPRGTRHSVSNTGPGTARLLIILSPPGFEGFWDEMANLMEASSGQPDPARVLALQKKYNMDSEGQTRRFASD